MWEEWETVIRKVFFVRSIRFIFAVSMPADTTVSNSKHSRHGQGLSFLSFRGAIDPHGRDGVDFGINRRYLPGDLHRTLMAFGRL
jgi:hypothetical protein